MEKRYEKLKNWPKGKNILIQERCFEEMFEIFIKTSFEKNLIDLKEFNILKNFYKDYLLDNGFSDIIIFLKCNSKNQLKRLKKRCRFLKNDSEFFSCINKKYDKFFDIIKNKYKGIKIFEVDTNNLNETQVYDQVKKILDLYYN